MSFTIRFAQRRCLNDSSVHHCPYELRTFRARSGHQTEDLLEETLFGAKPQAEAC